jgi:diguanylate cyclase (GGDEF)-like protein
MLGSVRARVWRARPKAGWGETRPHLGVAIRSTIRILAHDGEHEARPDAWATRRGGPPDGGLDEVLSQSFAVSTFDRAVRVLAWSFILVVWLVVSVSQLWQPVEPQIYATLILAGVFVLAVHELLPPDRVGTARVVAEGSAAIVFLTMLVVLTGNWSSPFFFLYPLLVGATALIAAPAVTLLLTVEAVVAYTAAALTGHIDSANLVEVLTRIGINLTALVLLAYAGLVIARVQRRTRDAAIRLSTVDSLTDLYNRAFLFNAVEHEIERARRYRRGFCLLMMDLDGLKAINDSHGHYQGDVVLRSVAEIIKENLRGIDVAARYGGDEFVALLPETDPSGAYVVAEKIRQVACGLHVESGGHKIGVSLSIGIVSYPEDGRTADQLMIAADEAMYSAKRLGKNMVRGVSQPCDANAANDGSTRRQTDESKLQPPASTSRSAEQSPGG